jgi:fumarate hydratase class II
MANDIPGAVKHLAGQNVGGPVTKSATDEPGAKAIGVSRGPVVRGLAARQEDLDPFIGLSGRGRAAARAYNRPMTDTAEHAAPSTERPTRTERDSMGEMEVPAEALYGASTQRAVLNFPISGQRMPARFLRALALIKLAAAETNADLSLLDRDVAAAIADAAREVATGQHPDQFPIDLYQTGSATSTNTNMNEVLARLASDRLDGRRVHPNDHVNICQSSNDVIPTAMQLSAAIAIEEELVPALIDLQAALAAKADEFWPIVKTGRTHLQDATPIRLGQEFAGYAGQVEEAIRRARAARDELLSVPLGGAAVGTGINAHPEYAARACARLTEITGVPVREADNHFHAQATLDTVVAAHGGLRAVALGMWKVASDVRLMAMGPRAGIAEIALPETQPGSSIMPGKVNPVIVESLTMVVARVVGNDATIGFCQTGSFLELNVMMPVAAAALLESITLLGAAARNFAVRCVAGITATERGPALVEQGLMLATALAPEIGYDEAAKLAKEALRTGRTIRELATERGIAADRLDQLLDPARMTEPGLGGGPAGG